MRTGEQAQTVLKRRRGEDPGAERVGPAERREDPAVLRPAATSSRLTTRTVEENLLRGILLVIVVLIFFLSTSAPA